MSHVTRAVPVGASRKRKTLAPSEPKPDACLSSYSAPTLDVVFELTTAKSSRSVVSSTDDDDAAGASLQQAKKRSKVSPFDSIGSLHSVASPTDAQFAVPKQRELSSPESLERRAAEFLALTEIARVVDPRFFEQTLSRAPRRCSEPTDTERRLSLTDEDIEAERHYCLGDEHVGTTTTTATNAQPDTLPELLHTGPWQGPLHEHPHFEAMLAQALNNRLSCRQEIIDPRDEDAKRRIREQLYYTLKELGHEPLVPASLKPGATRPKRDSIHRRDEVETALLAYLQNDPRRTGRRASRIAEFVKCSVKGCHKRMKARSLCHRCLTRARREYNRVRAETESELARKLLRGPI